MNGMDLEWNVHLLDCLSEYYGCFPEIDIIPGETMFFVLLRGVDSRRPEFLMANVYRDRGEAVSGFLEEYVEWLNDPEEYVPERINGIDVLRVESLEEMRIRLDLMGFSGKNEENLRRIGFLENDFDLKKKKERLRV